MDPKNINRVYSTMVVKAVDEDKREITGIASTPGTDRMGDIVEPGGAEFKLPIPLLWQHDHSQPIGNVVAARVTDKGIEIRATLVKPTDDMPSQLIARLSEAWLSIKTGLVRGLSIGFSPLEYSFMEDGIRFLKWNWHELSAVTVPANAEASITSIKSLDTALRASSGSKAQSGVGPAEKSAPPPGVSGTPKQPASGGFIYARKKGKDSMNIAEQIEAAKAKISALQKSMEDLMNVAADAGTTLDAAQSEEFDGHEAEVASITAHLKRLESMQKTAVATARPVVGTSDEAAAASRGGPVSVKNTQKLEKGIEFTRFAMCRIAAKGNPQMALQLAKMHYSENERVVKALELEAHGHKLDVLMKAVVEAGTTLDTTWAAPLVEYQNFAGDFVEYTRARTIIGQFGVGSIPSLNRIPFNVRIAGQTSGGAAQWVGEGAPKPLTAFDFTSTELRWAKVAAISVLTNELIRFSSPSAERLVRDALAGAVIERIDVDFVDPAKTAVANISPASITNGATAIVSSGTDAEAIRRDVQALWAPFIAARNAPRNAVYIMDSTTALALSLLQNPLGQSEFPGITMNGGTFMGVPVIVSDYLPADSGGGIVVLMNASDVWLADDGQVTIDASQEASLQMLDNPTNNSATGTPTTMVSMFQTNSTAFRAERYINWARRRASGVAYLTGVNWGAGA
ncbi:phage major capsid protein [Delftia sp. RIT313]|uniref:phage major capsid protein n=1 Tax=Delftia sp. RIT313 TaxID=1468410 RepID=UPI0004515217|nr:phage major capsid protein [Delftia sp. RIT313]EZP51400.1 HK97 family phage prohead protease [Delftia sp. RIT313]